MATENTVTTQIARDKFAHAHGGDDTLTAITEIAFGNGGHDAGTGEPIPPDDTATTVPGELIKKAIDSHSYPVATTLEIVGNVDDIELGTGYEISSCGLYDADGDLIAIKTFSPKTMSADMIIEVTWDELF